MPVSNVAKSFTGRTKHLRCNLFVNEVSDEEERIIDEFCGMKVPTEGVKSPPQYPLNTHQFEENIFCYRGKSPGEPGLVISPMFNLYKE